MNRWSRAWSCAVVVCSLALVSLISLSKTAFAQSAPVILTAERAGKLLPDAVYYAGKSAATQLRNAAGLELPGGHYALAVLVDTSGYSSSVQDKYQGYLLSEVALRFGGHQLPPGAYGFGFAPGRFQVMDIGNHDLLQATSSRDGQMQRPVPLQILDAGGGSYRLCSGRNCVRFEAAE